MKNAKNSNTRITLFKGKRIRKTIYHKEWWFSVIDIVEALTDSPQPKTYWAKMKERDKEFFQPFPIWEQLKMPAEDGKMRETDCANTEGIFRIIQSIPSPKAEPLFCKILIKNSSFLYEKKKNL
ncbi:MAG: Bro-N domain-containing protein [bacterium]|nr:Bro-N domain-containing protein [bacterium]